MKNKDKLHFTWRNCLSYNKIWNFAIGERESGKSTDGWLKIWSAYHYEHRPSIVLRRRIADITSAYIEDQENLFNKFLEKPIQLLYMKGDLKSGIVDVKLGDADANYNYNQIKKLPTFFRIVALSIPMNRIKSLMLNDVKFFFMDEFLVNLRGGEAYLKADEYFLIQELYTTYNREASTPIRILCAGNPYSVYCPLFNGLNVDTRKLKPGAFLVGDNYVIDCFQVPEELKKIILKNNPMYQFDDAYKRYAFSGESINDQNIRIFKTEPKGFKMLFVVRLGRDYLSIHKGRGKDGEGDFKYWCCKHGSDWLPKVSKKRKIIVFNWQDMMEGTVRYNTDQLVDIAQIRGAMERREITYNCIDAQYMLEDVYSVI